MKNSLEISAVVVTFNRYDLLKNCLEKLVKVKEVSSLYIVDNASKDETREVLDQFLSKYPHKIKVKRLPTNTGGAGGFRAALEWAYREGEADWFWLMDDDVEPIEGIVNTMLSYSHISKCIHPSKKFDDGEVFEWEGWFNIGTGQSLWYGEQFRKTEKPYTVVNYGCFEGMFIHRDIVQKIGFPDERFFIHDDDLIYGLLASKHTNVLYLKEFGLIKKIKKNNIVNKFGIKKDRGNPFNEYFNIRNHFLINDYLVREFGANRAIVNLFLMAKIMKRFFEALLFDFPNMKTLKMVLYGLCDGLKKDFSGHKRFLT